MDWRRDAPTWPLSENSQFIDVRPHHWHVQRLGSGPVAVLLHGAGGATQSFRHLAPLLAQDFDVLMMDFPGQGFTRLGTRQRSGLPETSADIAALLSAFGVAPDLIVAHSAGAAVALTLAADRPGTPVVGINPALGHFEGTAGWLFPVMAKLLALNPFVPGFFARMARQRGRVDGLLASTGSRLDPAGTDLYRRLISDRDHVDGTLLMMANWSIDPLLERLPEIDAPVLFLTGEQDGAVPPKVARTAAERMQRADVRTYSGEGHLLHETAPEAVATAVKAFATACGVLQPSSA